MTIFVKVIKQKLSYDKIREILVNLSCKAAVRITFWWMTRIMVCMSLDELDTGGNLINLSRYCSMFRSLLLFRVCNYPNVQRLFCVSSDRELILEYC